MKQILFVNGSPNRNGNTVAMAHRLLSGKNMRHCILLITKYILWGNLLQMTSLRKSCK